MEIKTKFNIGDKIYYIDKMRNSGIIIDKYIIDDLKIYEGLNDEELKTLIKIAKENNKTGGGCKPIIHVYKDYKADGDYYITESNYNYETFKYEWETKDLVGSDK